MHTHANPNMPTLVMHEPTCTYTHNQCRTGVYLHTCTAPSRTHASVCMRALLAEVLGTVLVSHCDDPQVCVGMSVLS